MSERRAGSRRAASGARAARPTGPRADKHERSGSTLARCDSLASVMPRSEFRPQSSASRPSKSRASNGANRSGSAAERSRPRPRCGSSRAAMRASPSTPHKRPTTSCAARPTPGRTKRRSRRCSPPRASRARASPTRSQPTRKASACGRGAPTTARGCPSSRMRRSLSTSASSTPSTTAPIRRPTTRASRSCASRAPCACVTRDVTDEVTVEVVGAHSPGHLLVWINSGAETAVMVGHLALSPLHFATGECPQQHPDPPAAEGVLERLRGIDALLIGPLWPTPGAGYWVGAGFTPATPAAV